MEVGDLISCAKGSAGTSIRTLAFDAQVAGSTITRIQAGVVDPSVQTLRRILEAAGFELRLDAIRRGAPRPPRLADLAGAWKLRDGRLRLDWTRWRAFLDALARKPEMVPEAIYVTPPPAGHRVVDALLASVAEKLADDAGLPRPSWTAQVATLSEPFRPAVARTVADGNIPAQLAARGLMIDTESLWRAGETVGV